MVETTATRCREIGHYIIEHADDITAQWERESIDEQPLAAKEQREALLDSLPDYLKKLGRNLLGGDPTPPEEQAAEHGEQRWDLKWDIRSVIRDYTLLRRVLLERVECDLPHCMSDAVGVALAIDQSVAASVVSYVKFASAEMSTANERLARMNVQLGEFAHVVAHEVRNPVAAATMALNQLQPALPDALQAPAAQLGSFLDAALATITRLLAFARADQQSVETTPVDLNAILRQAQEALHPLIVETAARIHTTLLPTVLGSESLLRMVFKNLLENAIKYTKGRTPNIVIASVERDAEYIVSVSDNGVGIPNELVETVFDFGVRIHDERLPAGTGIGLAFCRRVVESHGGRIWVESKTNQGSTFNVSFPSLKGVPES